MGQEFQFFSAVLRSATFLLSKREQFLSETLGKVQLLEGLGAEGPGFLQDGEEMRPASVFLQFCADIFILRCSLSAQGQAGPQAADDISSHRHFSS